MVDSQWSMVDSQWSMVDSQWSMVDGQWLILLRQGYGGQVEAKRMIGLS